MKNNLREWVKSRMDLQKNCIVKAINKTQYVFWQTNILREKVKAEIIWQESYKSAYNEKRKKLFWRLCDRASILRQKLEASEEWKMFGVLSNENRVLRQIFGIKFNLEWELKYKTWAVEECLLNSKDVL